MAGLKVFEGFSLEMASEFTGLKEHEINWLRVSQVVNPEKKSGVYLYTFQDLLMLRLVRLLRLYGVKPRNIRAATRYLKDFDGSKSLINLELFIRKDKKTILYLGEEPDDNILVSLSEQGQLQSRRLLWILPIGAPMEMMRRQVVKFDNTLSKRLRSKKVIPFDQVLKKYGLG